MVGRYSMLIINYYTVLNNNIISEYNNVQLYYIHIGSLKMGCDKDILYGSIEYRRRSYPLVGNDQLNIEQFNEIRSHKLYYCIMHYIL